MEMGVASNIRCPLWTECPSVSQSIKFPGWSSSPPCKTEPKRGDCGCVGYRVPAEGVGASTGRLGTSAFLHTRSQRKGSHLQIRMLSSADRICWHPGLRPRNGRNKWVLFNPFKIFFRDFLKITYLIKTRKILYELISIYQILAASEIILIWEMRQRCPHASSQCTTVSFQTVK